MAPIIVGAVFVIIGFATAFDQLLFGGAVIRWQGRLARSKPFLLWGDTEDEVSNIYGNALLEFEATGQVEIDTFRKSNYLPEFSNCTRHMYVFLGSIFLIMGLGMIAAGIISLVK